MRPLIFLTFLTCLTHAAPEALFDGKTLAGWRGNPDFWTVEDGVITGRTTTDKPTSNNTFLIWNKPDIADFEITFQYKMKPGDGANFVNSGFQFRSKIVDEKNYVVAGYQADLEFGDEYSGILYEEKGRGILARRGQKVTITSGSKPASPEIAVTGEVGDSAKTQAAIQKNGWNEYRIIAQGNHIRQFINGNATVDVIDQSAEAVLKGVLAFQLHAGSPMQIQIKDICYTAK